MRRRIGLAAVTMAMLLVASVRADDRFERGIVGEIVAVDIRRSPATITIQLEETQTRLNLDVAKNAQVKAAFEDAALADLKPGAFAALELADDFRTVRAVQARGETVAVTLRTIDAAKGIVTASLEGEEDGDDVAPAVRPQPREFLISPAARLRIGRLPATLADLQPGMNVPLELGKDGKSVHGLDAEAAEGTLIEGRLVELNAANRTIKALIEQDDQETELSFTITTAENLTLDGKKCTLADLKPGSEITLRLNASKASVQALAATSPKADGE